MAHIVTQPQNVQGIEFMGSITPPGSSNSLFLAGAGPRGLTIEGQFVVFTAIAVYLGEAAVQALAPKWKGKTPTQLNDSPQFFEEIYAGNFEWLTRVAMIHPLTGPEYTGKVTENCIRAWKEAGIYTDDKAQAIAQFVEVFKNQKFPHGTSILFYHKNDGELSIAFTQDSTVPTTPATVIQNKALSVAILASIIGEHGVSPATRENLAKNLSEIMQQSAPNGSNDL